MVNVELIVRPTLRALLRLILGLWIHRPRQSCGLLACPPERRRWHVRHFSLPVVGSRRSGPPIFDSAPGPLAAIVYAVRACRILTGIAARYLARRSASHEVLFPSAFAGRTVRFGDAAPNHPASTFFATVLPTLPVAAFGPCGLFASRHLGSAASLFLSGAAARCGSFTG